MLWEHLRRLAADGPTEAELALEIEGARESYADPRYVELDLAHASEAILLSLPFTPRPQRLAGLAEVTQKDMQDRVAAALATAQIVVPFGVTPHLPGLAEGGCAWERDEPRGRR